MQIALITANIGGIDQVETPVLQETAEMRCDYHCFTEKTLPYPLPNLSARLRGKYLKMLTHRFLPQYDAYVWVDGRIAIVDARFVVRMVANLKQCEVAISRHHQRRNAYDEIDFIVARMAAGDQYLLERYRSEPWDQERAYYEREGLPVEMPLYACCAFARRNEARVNGIFEDWWLRSLEFTLFDQAMFSFVAWKHQLKVFEFSADELYGPSIVVRRHVAHA